MTAEENDRQKLYLSKTRTTPTFTTPPTSPSRGSNHHHESKSRRSSKRSGGNKKVQLADGDNREPSSSRRSSKRTSNVDLSPKSDNGNRFSNRKIQLAEGDFRRSSSTPSSPMKEKPHSRQSSSSRRSSSRRSSNTNRRSHTNKNKSRQPNDDDHDASSASSSEHPGAFPVDSLNPRSANSTTTHTITSRSSDAAAAADVMIAAEISPDRELEVRQAYEQGAQDMRNAALEENNALQLRVRELEEQTNNNGTNNDNIILAVAREDEEEKRRFSKGTVCCCFLFCVLALAGAIVGGIFGLKQADPSSETNIVVILPPSLQDCESVVNETGIVHQAFVESTSLYLDMAVIKESDSGMDPSELQNLKQRILLYILTVLLGCTEEDIRTLEAQILGNTIENNSIRWLQEENLNNNNNNNKTIFHDYVVGNTLISDIRVWQSNEACLEYYPEEGDHCTHVRLVLEVYLQVEIPQDELLRAVTSEFQREPLVPRLKLIPYQPYELIEVVHVMILPEDYIFEPNAVSNTTTTPVPTLGPTSPIFSDFSSAPSWSPSFSPSSGGRGQGNGGSDNPPVTTEPVLTPAPSTLAPTTPNPTLAPSPDPTPSPTKEPTKAPTLAPSPPPTVLPTRAPTQFPTKRPTPRPTPNPTAPPTTANPSPRPSRPPSPNPTQSPSASPSACPTPSCAGSSTCQGFSSAMTIHPCGSCLLDQDCSYSGSMNIGKGSCNGKEECNAGYGNVIGDNSCNGNDVTWDGTSSTHSCAHLHTVQIGSNSCNCAECCACFDYGVIKGDNECNTPGDCCTVFGGTQTVGAGSCGDSAGSRTYSCLGSKGTIGMNSCNGIHACKNQRDLIGDSSCNGVAPCEYHSGDIGDNSCVGYKACFGGWDATIGDGSCNGTDACKERKRITIGDGSCNCQSCCACLPENVIVPDGSCNVRAASASAIDFVSGVGGTQCCYYAALPP